MATHSSTLAWKIPWTEEPGGLQSTGSLRVGHDWMTSLSLFTFMHWRGNVNPLQCSCLENPRDGGAWWAAVYGVTQSRTRLKWLSSSSSSSRHVNTWMFHTLNKILIYLLHSTPELWYKLNLRCFPKLVFCSIGGIVVSIAPFQCWFSCNNYVPFLMHYLQYG